MGWRGSLGRPAARSVNLSAGTNALMAGTEIFQYVQNAESDKESRVL